MNILTIGPSPYLLTREGRVNRDVISALKARGHHVQCLATYHDILHFLPHEDGIHYYDHENGTRTRLHPHLQDIGTLSVTLIDVMKKVQPSLVISIGDYSECAAIYHLKAKFSSLFKWIIINTTGMDVVNEKYREPLNLADIIFATCKSATSALRQLCSCQVEHIPYGPAEKFTDLNIRDTFSAIIRSNNRQSCNLGAFIRAMAMADAEGTIHTNIDDQGDYDLRLLINRYKMSEKLKLPNKFVSIREGVPHYCLNEMYNRHCVAIDCSFQSGTALSLLEAMSTGCIPIGMNFGAVGDVLNELPEEFRLFVRYETLLGPGQEEHAIISVKDLAVTIENMKKRFTNDPLWFQEAGNEVKEVARIFSNRNFVNRIVDTVEKVLQSEHAIVVDTY
jgi:hypothetical protein